MADRAVPGATPRDSRLRDRGPAAVARLSFAAVNAKLVLHPPAASVGTAVVAERCSLTADPEPQSLADPVPERGHLLDVELAGRDERMNPGVPERLVGVNVPDPRRRPLVEQRRLDGCPTSGERPAEPLGREGPAERLDAQATGGEVVVELPRFEQLPRSETADVPIHDVRSVV